MDFFASNDELALLDAELELAQGMRRMVLLVSLAWHLRQRDCQRALHLSAQAQALLQLEQQQELSVQAQIHRLHLVTAEVGWLHGDFAASRELTETALLGFSVIGDVLGCADAHWLQACIAYDQGNLAQCSAALQSMLGFAQQDSVRLTIAQANLVRNAIWFDIAQARRNWQHWTESACAELPTAARCWVEDVWGIISNESGEYVQAVQRWSKAYGLAIASGQIRRALTSALNLGDAFNNLNDYHSALGWMERGLEIARACQSPGLIGLALNWTADTHYHLRNFDIAHELLQEAISMMSVMAESRYFAIALQYLGDVQLQRKQFASALASFQLLEQRANLLLQTDLQFVSRRGQAQSYLELGQGSAALEAAQRAFAGGRARPDLEIELLMVMAEIYARESLPAPLGCTSLSPSLHYLQTALDLMTNIANYIATGEILDAVAREYAKLGDVKQAYHYARQASVAREKLFSHEAHNRALAMQVAHQTEKTRVLEAHRCELAAEAKRAEILRQTSETLEHLGAIGQKITVHLDLTDIFAVMHQEVQHLLEADTFCIYLPDAAQQNVYLAFGVKNGALMPDRSMSLDNLTFDTVRCVRERCEILRDHDPSQVDVRTTDGTQPSGTRLFAPLFLAERLLGVMSVQADRRYAYRSREQLIFRTLCSYAAIALSNAEAHGNLAKAHQQLLETQQQMVLQGKMAGLGSLTAGVAHEINNPTNFVHVAAQNQLVDLHEFQHYVVQLVEADEAPEVLVGFTARFNRLRANIHTMLAGTARIKGIVRDLRSFTRLDEADKKTVRLSECVNSTLNLVRSNWHEQVQFSIEIIDDPALECWPALLNQVLMNLLLNGCQAIQQKIQTAHLQGQAQAQAQGQLLIRMQTVPDAVEIAIIDDGIGMPAANLPRIFEPFYTTKAPGSGTGLGLAIAFGIVRQHGGQLLVESTEGRGSCFTLRLPMRPQEG